MENWAPSYKIVVGAPEYQKEAYLINLTSVLKPEFLPKITVDSTTIPSNARSLSNLESEGSSQRGFTFTLDSTRSMTQGSNASSEKTTLELYNLDDDMIEVINLDNCVIRIYAGYGGEVSLAYSGDVAEVTPLEKGDDIVHRLSCIDGLGSIKNTIGNIDYAETMSVADVIVDLADKFPDSSLGAVGLDALDNVYITGGLTFMGYVEDSLDSMLTKYNLSMGRYNGKIVIAPYVMLPGGEDYRNFVKNNYNLTQDLIQAIIPASDNGTKTSDDTKKKRNISVSTFYIPIELGQFFTIPAEVSSEYAGTYLVQRIRTKLQSQGNAWSVVVSGAPID